MAPQDIKLYTRRGINETTLHLSSQDGDSYIYSIEARYPYWMDYDEKEIIAIDFSEGPKLYLGDKLEGMEIVKIEEGFITLK